MTRTKRALVGEADLLADPDDDEDDEETEDSDA